MTMESLPLVVIGAGPAGLSCAIAAARLGMPVRVLEALAPGGELGNLLEIHDLPGAVGPTQGSDFAAGLLDTALDLGVELDYTDVASLEQTGDGVWSINDGIFIATAVVLATGTGVDFDALAGSRDLFGAGVSTCASCDGPLYKGKTVAVVGSGRDAAHEAALLAGFAERVVAAGDWNTKHGAHWRDSVPVTPRLGFVAATGPLSVAPVERGVAIAGADESIMVDGVFLAAPRAPRSELLGLTGPVPVDGALEVQPGLYAVGDARAGSSMTVAGALGDGVTAAWQVWSRAANA